MQIWRPDEAASRLREWLKGPPATTQAELADKLGVSQQTVSAWCNAIAPSIVYRIKLRRHTGIPVELWTEPARRAASALTPEEEREVLTHAAGGE